MSDAADQPRAGDWQRWGGYCAVVAMLAAFAWSPPAGRLDRAWLDSSFRLLRALAPLPVQHDIVVVGLDDADLREFGMPVAILHHQLGAFLQAMAAAKPAAVGLDVVLPAASADRLQPGLDAALARGLITARAVTPLVLGLTTDTQGRPRPLHAPFLRLAGENGVGFVLLPRDEDLVVRRIDDQLAIDGKPVPTMVGNLARALGHVPRNGYVQYALGQPFDYVPMREVLAWAAAGDTARLAQRFGGRVVLLGSVLAHDDQHAAPVRIAAWDDETDTSHGVLLHAQQLRTLLADAVLAPTPRLAGLLVVLLFATSWWLGSGRRGWLTVTALCLAVLGTGLYALRAGQALPVQLAVVSLLGGLGARTALTAWLSSQERRRLRASFGGMVSPSVLQEMLAGRLTPEFQGARRDICVLFSDIRSFTTLSETMAPEDVTAMLNDYFGRMTRAIHAHGGTLDKFIGDGIMAFFGAPLASASPCDDAFATARSMLEELAAFNAGRQARGLPTIAIGIGLHYGPAVVGYIGSQERNEYSAIGDTVNAASRIEGLTKDAGFPVLLSAAAAAQVTRRDELVAVGAMAIKGRAAIEVFGWRPPAGNEEKQS